jgi:DNA (cytosine-5)-methyltransferase 1
LANVGRTYTQEGTGNFRLTNVVMQPVHVVNGNSTPEVSEELAFPLRADDGSGNRQAIAFSAKDHGADAGEVSPTLRSMGHDGSHANGGGQVAVAFMENVRGELRVSEQSDALTTGGGKPGQGYAAVLEPVTFESRFARNGRGAPDTIVPPLKAQSGETGKGDAAPLVAFSIMPMNSGKDYKARETDVAQPIMAGGPVGGNQGGDFIKSSMQVRRLTPVECERLQGFADDYTLVPWRGGMSPDGNRYKALGNSMAVPVMRWIGQRIALVEGIK